MFVMATAGHVDHGKSTLVRVLTGTDPDRFAEEKQRGLTIDLGFAELAELGIAFVDVPGHVRFVRNMLAGVGMVEAALFVVDVHEGWKPQSEEHLRILDLVGVDRGVVALTKVDDPELADVARLEVAEHLEGSGLAGAPIVAVDALSGLGMDELRAELAHLAAGPRRAHDGRARLWVDRSFTLPGAGTVVTGTLTGGRLGRGDEVEVAGRRVRSRRLQCFGADVEVAEPGSRVAVNLAGVAPTEVARGDTLVHPGRWHRTRRFDAAVEVLGSAPRAIGGRGALALHVGSAERTVRVTGGGSVAPGGRGWLRLTIDAALPLQPGDRFVLRDLGEGITVAGGEVLDVDPVLPQSKAAPDRSVDRVVAERGWIDVDDLERCTGERRPATVGRWVVSPERLATDLATLEADVAGAGPLGLDVRLLDERRRALLDHLDVAVAGGRARAGADDLDRHPWLAALAASPFEPPPPAGVDPAALRLLVQRGLVVERDGVHFAPSAVEQAAAAVTSLLAGSPGGVTTSAVRQALGTSRRVVVPLLGLLDASGLTVRRGDVRLPGPRFRRMDLTPYRHTATITIDRPAADVYAIVSDIGRMGELSPVATGGTWDDPATGAAPGAWFTGANAIGEFTWETRCRVEAAEPGKEFTFVNAGPADVEDMDLVKWSYTFADNGDGTCEAAEHWEVLPDYVPFTRGDSDMSDDDVRARIDGMAVMARDGMAATLANLKAIAES